MVIVCWHVIIVAGDPLSGDLSEKGTEPQFKQVKPMASEKKEGIEQSARGKELEKGQEEEYLTIPLYEGEEGDEGQREVLTSIEYSENVQRELKNIERNRDSLFTVKSDEKDIDRAKYNKIYATVLFAQKNVPIKLTNSSFNQEQWVWKNNELKSYTKPVGVDDLRDDINQFLKDVTTQLLSEFERTTIPAIESLKPISNSILTHDDIKVKVREFGELCANLKAECIQCDAQMQAILNWGLSHLPIVKQLRDDGDQDQLLVTYLPYQDPTIARYYVHHVRKTKISLISIEPVIGEVDVYVINNTFTDLVLINEADAKKAIEAFKQDVEDALKKYLGIKATTSVIPQPQKKIYHSFLRNHISARYVIVGADSTKNQKWESLNVEEQTTILPNKPIVSWTSENDAINIKVQALGPNGKPDGKNIELKPPDDYYKNWNAIYTLKGSSFLSNMFKSGVVGGAAAVALAALKNRGTVLPALVTSLSTMPEMKQAFTVPGLSGQSITPAVLSAATKVFGETMGSPNYKNYAVAGLGLGVGLYGLYVSQFTPQSWPAAKNVFANATSLTGLGSAVGAGLGRYAGFSNFSTGVTSGIGGLLGLLGYSNLIKDPVYIELSEKTR